MSSGRGPNRWMWISRTLLGAVFIMTILNGPVLYASGVIDDEDRFVAVSDRVMEHPDIRQAVASEVTALTFDALEADEALASGLPASVQPFAVPLTRLASEQVTSAAFTLLDSEPAVEARQAALRELHGQVTEDADDVVVDLRAVLVLTAREIGGPAAGFAIANIVADSDTGRFTLAERGSANAGLFALMRSVPNIGTAMGLTTLALLALAVAAAADRRRTLVAGGLAIAAGTIVSTVLFSFMLYATQTGPGAALDPLLGRAIAETLSTDFAQQQRGGVWMGFGFALIGLLLGDRPASVGLRDLPRAIWSRDKNRIALAISAVFGANPPFARLFIWLTGALVLASWSRPSARVVLTVVGLTVLALLAVWLFSSPSSRATRSRTSAGLPPTVGLDAPAETDRLSLKSLVLGLLLLLGFFWPTWTLGVAVGFFSTGPGHGSARSPTRPALGAFLPGSSDDAQPRFAVPASSDRRCQWRTGSGNCDRPASGRSLQRACRSDKRMQRLRRTL